MCRKNSRLVHSLLSFLSVREWQENNKLREWGFLLRLVKTFLKLKSLKKTVYSVPPPGGVLPGADGPDHGGKNIYC
jgi:hypothetical protein